ncbi:hypothetical protein PG996_009905 [Apiospora saccharicola]|uniref:FAD-binding domain-containing protein n=1 Tax=Apiospora saccharicola TaxID=335842 RepID=A0ABR1UPH5_9PEZI
MESSGLPGNQNLHIAIVGAGIGGLTCAIACRRMNKNLKVTVLERSAEVLPLGTGIHIPPNAGRVLAHLGLLDRVKKEAAGYQMDRFILHRYEDGQILADKPVRGRAQREYGSEWIVIHRGDYHAVLLSEARQLGAEILTGAEAIGAEQSQLSRETVVLKGGRCIEADVVIGADGLWSSLRETVLGRPFSPTETGDLAYRGTFPREKLLGLGNEKVDRIIEQDNLHVWLGPGRHAVFYPLRNRTEYNLVLLVADDLAEGVKMAPSSLEEMNAHFDGWDPILKDIISCQDTPLKWKLLHFESLDKWTKGPIALLGDATHPTLPYQGQGAAMAVEDAAVLGLLLARSLEKGLPADTVEKRDYLSALLQLYQDLRKRRTETNVAGAVHTQHYYHLADGEEQHRRDAELEGLAGTGWQGACSFNWGDAEYQRSLLGFDVIADSKEKFEDWWVSYQEAGAKDGLF